MQQRPIVSFAILALVLAAPCTRAQDMPDMKPAAELQKYAPFVGAWKGSGTYQPTPEAPKIKWTVHEEAKWVLGGHFLEVRTEVAFTGDMPPMSMRGLYGWDREARRHVMLASNSMGKVARAYVDFAADGTMLIATMGTHEGKPYLSRETVRFAKDRYELKIENAMGTGPFFVEVEGVMERAADAKLAAVAAEASAAKPGPEMAKMQRLLGTWQVKGTMIPSPGAPPMEISGRETYEAAPGGNVLHSHTVGDPVAMPGATEKVSYEGISFLGWNPESRCYEWVSADSMGMVGYMRTWWSDEHTLVMTCSDPMMGQPCAMRGILAFGKDGQPAIRFSSERFPGAGPMLKDFEATYTRAR